jgi:tRNA (cytidine56-2'-O)-methyltransferase
VKRVSDQKEVVVLRIGHRPQRDARVTTHVGLTARALGAQGMYLTTRDTGVTSSILDVAGRFGGAFFVEDGKGWRSCISDWKAGGGTVVHLTMYGLNLPDVEDSIREHKRILVVVGAEKVPGEVYGLADYNVAVGSQPHSEIAALAIFLDHYYRGTTLSQQYSDARVTIIPSARGKTTQER